MYKLYFGNFGNILCGMMKNILRYKKCELSRLQGIVCIKVNTPSDLFYRDFIRSFLSRSLSSNTNSPTTIIGGRYAIHVFSVFVKLSLAFNTLDSHFFFKSYFISHLSSLHGPEDGIQLVPWWIRPIDQK